METKAQIRKRHLKQRNSLSAEEVQRLSADVSRHLLSVLTEIPDLQERGIYAYYPLGNEVDLRIVYKKLFSQGCKIAFPRVNGAKMDFYEVQTLDVFERGSFGVMEPCDFCPKVAWTAAVCLVPGSVFDETGNRFGYGKGYYDRYFSKHTDLIRFGIAYEMQIESAILADEKDVRMQRIVTNQKCRYII